MSTSTILSSTENIPKLREPADNDSVPPKSNSEFFDTPAWLTKDYFQNCLRSYYGDDKLKITKFEVKPAIGRGENYGGVLTRARVEFLRGEEATKSSGSYIVKTSFEGDEFVRDRMEPYDIFNREMAIYEGVLPKLNKMLQEIGDKEQIFAETFAVDKERSALIFEDLNERDFIMPNRLEGLDMKLTKMVLRKLAKMHATSAVLNERENGSLESYDRGMFNRHTENYAPAFLGFLAACSRRVAQWENFEEYARKLDSLKAIYMEQAKRTFDVVDGRIHVLAHGDIWTNNVMVKYDKATGEPLDVIIIDFQYSAWGSPAIDLHYFFNTSLKEDMHVNRQDELVHFYYGVFADTLRKLAYKASIPSLHKFHLQLEEKAFYAFSSTCVVLPVHRNVETKDADFKALMQEDERAINFKDTCLKNPYCQRIIRRLLPVYERRGLLDLDQ